MKNGGESKGQVAIFMIIAVILIAAGVLAYYFNNSNRSNLDSSLSQDVQVKVNAVLNSITDCRELSADSSVKRISLQGGYFRSPENYLDFGWMFVPYYYINNKTYLPTKAKIESELAKSFDETFYNCVLKISEDNVSLKLKEPKTSVFISDEIKFDTNIDFSIEIFGKTQTYNLLGEVFSKNYSLFNMYSLSEYIIESHNTPEKILCVDCLVDKANEKNLYVDFVSLGDENKMVIITQATGTNQTGEYAFQFLEKYNAGEKTTVPTIPDHA